jgi:predicted permease
VLAVATLIWFSPRQMPHRERARLTLSGLVTNPLILACVAGMIWARLLPPMPVAMATTLRLAASLTLPLALLSIGGSLTLKAVQGHAALASLATVLKCAILPLVGYALLRALGIEGDDRLIAMLFFAMPASTAMYVLATQLDSDASLASAIIVTSTIASFVSLSAVLLIFG